MKSLMIIFLLLAIIRNTCCQDLRELPELRANPYTVTLSGFSSGAFMTNQIHIAYSGTIKGAGMIAGGPFQVLELIFGPQE